MNTQDVDDDDYLSDVSSCSTSTATLFSAPLIKKPKVSSGTSVSLQQISPSVTPKAPAVKEEVPKSTPFRSGTAHKAAQKQKMEAPFGGTADSIMSLKEHKLRLEIATLEGEREIRELKKVQIQAKEEFYRRAAEKIAFESILLREKVYEMQHKAASVATAGPAYKEMDIMQPAAPGFEDFGRSFDAFHGF